MNTAALYQKLTTDGKLSAANHTLDLDRAYLNGLHNPTLDVTKLRDAVVSCFPNGKISIIELDPFTPPVNQARIHLTGKGGSPPFHHLSKTIELWTEETTPGHFEARIAIATFGDGPWTLSDGFPLYRDTLIGGARFALSGMPARPLLTAASHDDPARGIIAGISVAGLLELDSILDSTPLLFLPETTRGKFVPVFGTITAFPPDDTDPHDALPFVSLYGRLPDDPGQVRLGGLFGIENVRYTLDASPDYDTAMRFWRGTCALTWSADLILLPASRDAANPHPAVVIPVLVEIEDRDGPILFRSDLTQGLALAWDVLRGCIPGASFDLPAGSFRPSKDIRLTELQIQVERNCARELTLDWVSLSVETDENHDRWPLIPGLLTLDAIDFHILVRFPFAERGFQFSLSGLVRIGQSGLLRLTIELNRSGQSTDLRFSGQLVDTETLHVGEVFSHFLGSGDRPELPSLQVKDLFFSVAPRTKEYSGEILLEGNWPIIPGSPAFVLRDVFFRLAHPAGEGPIQFQALGVFELAGALLYVSADYAGSAGGWTFSGGTYENALIPVGTWIKGIQDLLGLRTDIPLPAPIQGLTVSDLHVRFNTAKKQFSFQAKAFFPTDGNVNATTGPTLAIHVEIAGGAVEFHGTLTIAQPHTALEFAVDFATQGGTSLLVATYNGAKADRIDAKAFVTAISPTAGNMIPQQMSIALDHARLAYGRKGAQSKFLFGIELGAGIDLSNLPLVGTVFPRGDNLSIVFQILAANQRFEIAEIEAINRLTGPGVTPLPAEPAGQAGSLVQLKTAVHYGSINQRLDLPFSTSIDPSGNPAAAQQPSFPAISPPSTPLATKWIDIQKTLGPFHFQRFGIAVSADQIAFLLDASLQVGGLAISLDGLGAECTFASLSQHVFAPVFKLDGLGIDFKQADLEIGGALIRTPLAGGDYAFDGAVTIHYKQLGIEAVGSYRDIKGQPSLFVYALIDYPLGGPPFFFVKGGAAGFGYNRSLRTPSFDRVAEFPLVQQAIATTPKSPMAMKHDLDAHLTPTVGAYFLAAGINFTSFKTIEGFVLLTVLFGDHFEVAVMGKATLTSPPKAMATGQPPMLSASLVFLGRYLPDEGTLSIRAELTPDAHMFSPDCHLTGGFAFSHWFGNNHKGDFVLTLGGYHKSFRIPDHYPRVPRLGMNWQVTPKLSLKADAYFALTPSAVMAGGHLEANWQSGELRAWFVAGVDFLLGWQPYRYEGHVSVTIGASYRFRFFGWRTASVELTADLDIWGPPFSGKAHVKWYLISFDITFGDTTRRPAETVGWPDFRKSFLPAERLYLITARSGKVAPAGGKPDGTQNPNQSGHLGMVNPRELCLTVNAAVPITQNWHPLTPPQDRSGRTSEPRVGIAPMGISHDRWNSTVAITIRHNGNNVTGQFAAEPNKQSMPKGLWGEAAKPDIGTQALIGNIIYGYDIKPKMPARESASLPADPAEKRQEGKLPDQRLAVLFHSAEALPFSRPYVVAETRRARRWTPARIAENAHHDTVRATRAAVLRDLLPNTSSDWGGLTADAWRAVPRVVKVGAEPIIS